MTTGDDERIDRGKELENTVDELEDKVVAESEAEGRPGSPTDRADTPKRGSTDEPPD